MLKTPPLLLPLAAAVLLPQVAGAEAPPGLWVHGDLHPGNLLVRNGTLAGVLDFGSLGVGDPAVDLMAAWTVGPFGMDVGILRL